MELTTERVELGASGVFVPRLWFGGSALGSMPNSYGYEVDHDRALQTIRAVFDGPPSVLDTSRNYAKSEARIGEVIRERGGIPDGFAVSTKLDRDPETGRFDGDRARRSIDESLTALGLASVDVLHLHDPEYARSLTEITAPRGALRELGRMKEEGLARAIGLAMGSIEMMTPLLADWDFDAVITHSRYTLVNRHADAMIDFASGGGVAVLNAAPYGSGVLAKGPDVFPRYAYHDATSERLDSVRAFEGVCSKHGLPLGAAALQFSMRDPRIAATICGVSQPQRVAQTFEWARWPIPDEVWTELEALPFDTEDPERDRVYVAD